MRNLYLLLISLLCFPCYIHGQSLLRYPFKKAPFARSYTGAQISKQLERRAAASFKQAAQQQSALNPQRAFTIGEPVHHVLHPSLDPGVIYPDKPFLTTSWQAAYYMTARNNRLLLNEQRRVEKLWAQIDQQLPSLQQAAQNTPQPKEPMAWLARQIAPQVNYLFVGEIHGFDEIKHSVKEFLTTLRAEQPHKEILLFTEFLPEELHYQPGMDPKTIPFYYHKYLPVWEQASQENISVIGLEPGFIIEDDCSSVFYLNRKGKYRKLDTWATLEGVRIRNEHWSKLLEQYRAEHPKALFIVYTGSGHSLYNYPFTLSTQFSKPNTYVVVLYPDQYLALESNSIFSAAKYVPTKHTGPLEELTQDVDFPQSVLQFKEDALAQLAGFNVRIKVPVNLELLTP